jgi:hypothetical protein
MLYSSYEHKPNGYWRDINNQRLFFEKLAHKLNIQNPADWLKVPRKTILAGGGSFIHRYYNSSITQGIYCVIAVIDIVAF